MLRDTAKILVILTALVWLARHPDVTVRVQRGVESASRYLTHALGLDSRNSRADTLQEKVSRPPAAVKQTSPQSSFTPERTMRSSRY